MDIRQHFIQLILDEWDVSSTNYGKKPEVTSGWLENDFFNIPTIMLVNSPEFVLGGGETGYSSMSASGKPLQRTIGDLAAICTTHEGMPDINGSPEYVCTQMRDELKRIVSSNYDHPFGDVQWISFYGANDVVDSTRQPIWFRWDCTLRYLYDYRIE